MSLDVEREFTRKDLELFARCLSRLDVMLERAQREPEDEAVRDSVVKRFEITYELAVKTLLHYLVWTAESSVKITGYDFQDLIRKGDQAGVLRTGWPGWKKYREARNRTVHTYREEVAIAVAAGAVDFAEEAHVLLDKLTERMEADA
jgi:nucleotidyltransferase substrate binding protein (TIGR01987 family)